MTDPLTCISLHSESWLKKGKSVDTHLLIDCSKLLFNIEKQIIGVIYNLGVDNATMLKFENIYTFVYEYRKETLNVSLRFS